MQLISQQYGKARVRVLKVIRDGATHHLKELTVSVMLEGDFAAAHEKGDNRLIVPTDTMKNTVYVLAQERLGQETEPFGLALGEHFLKHYAQVRQATLSFSEQAWQRMPVDGQPHQHSFVASGPGQLSAEIVCSREANRVTSGVDDLLILKSTGSGFEGYVKDRFTTLPETNDRILASQLKARWRYEKSPGRYDQSNQKIVAAMLKTFAVNYSPSVQFTLYQMGCTALQAVPEISQIHLSMPNQHCLLVNLSPFGLENRNEIFVPTADPHGLIEATIRRD
jgi:urate oxidase